MAGRGKPFQIDVPEFTAKCLENARILDRLTVDIHGKPVPLGHIGDREVRSEARRIAAIADVSQREQAIYDALTPLLAACIEGKRQAEAVLAASVRLQKLCTELAKIRGKDVTNFRPMGNDG